MNCNETKGYLYNFSKNLLDSVISSRVKEHIKNCSDCNENYGVLLSLQKKIKKSIVSPPTSVLFRIRQSSGEKPISVSLRAFALTAAALVFVAVFGFNIALRQQRIINAYSIMDQSYPIIDVSADEQYSNMSQSYLEEVGLND